MCILSNEQIRGIKVLIVLCIVEQFEHISVQSFIMIRLASAN